MLPPSNGGKQDGLNNKCAELHIGCNREWHTDNPPDDFIDGTWANTLAVEYDDKSQIFF